ncbi:GrpB family protein [Paracidobacterium acidisoli]|uniref:GrpB family protein n=1 Tax=Paracidobacterium acidisoli TaxID=2303751 RepID=A0A372IR87_9BACT|nr:GrpB family protein [Paracidobacterium acidisoli]MBT9330328.1 GrpB family protein [Paracidobacterium acidisoli]
MRDIPAIHYTNQMHDPAQARRALGHVSIVSPDPSWPEYFSRERARLRSFLGPLADELQHYGSTAVPGLSAKPIIDMMTPVASLEQADALSEQLAAAKYRRIDAGFFKRRFFRRTAADTNLAWHLHLVVAPAWPVKNELLLRDWLIRRPDVARAYEALKMELATAYGDDMPRYTEGKTIFLRKAVNDARLSHGLPAEHDWDE